MEKSIKRTVQSAVDYTASKIFSKYPSVRKAVERATNRYHARHSHAMLYSGLALVAASAAYLMVKNRGALTASVVDFIAERTGLMTSPKA
ncbi:MAG: hypothetical protein JWO58_625 [Chitinophagaceae bacterium]|nr:hypothetical protein [Chitinophagaceae bacterium]